MYITISPIVYIKKSTFLFKYIYINIKMFNKQCHPTNPLHSTQTVYEISFS